MNSGMVGEYCIARCSQAGVHAGVVIKHEGAEVVLAKARRLWRWKAAENSITLSGVAVHGLSTESRIGEEVREIWVGDVCELIPCTEVARSNIAAMEASNAQ